MIAGPTLEQLAQRVIARFHLDALSAEETRQYIAHRMAVAGLQGALPFTARALQRVHSLARGVPRRINLLCDRALLGAYAGGVREVNEATVDQAAREVFDAPPAARAAAGTARAPRWAVAGAGALAGAAAVACAGWALGWWPPTGAAAAGPGPVVAAAAQAPAASTASMAASLPAASAAATPVATPPSALQGFLALQPEGDDAAWRALATAWGAAAPAPGADACAALAREGLRCFRQRRAGLSLVRQLDRPGVMTLFTADGRPVPVVLSRLDGGVATLEGAGRTLQVPVADLAQAWRGEFATLWRAPPGLQEGSDVADHPATLAWLDAQLPPVAQGTAAAQRPAAAQRRDRIHRFQVAQGLAPDGRAGPLTLMLLNRAAGVDEPRLRKGA